jgi:hypothetical protein
MKHPRTLLAITLLFMTPGLVSGKARYPVQMGRGEEVLKYKLRYSIFYIGDATVTSKENREGKICFIRAEAHSNGFVGLFNQMNYILECSIDPVTGLPDSAVINLSDRKNTMFNELVFTRYAGSDSVGVHCLISGSHMLPRQTYEILSGYNYFRNYLLAKEGGRPGEFVISTFYPDRPWELRFRYAGKESLQSVLGTGDCYIYYPRTVAGKFFEKEDDMTVWFTCDQYHLPVKFRLNLKIGVLHGSLEEYGHTGN